jgi:general secretion pathway protein K
VTAILRSERGVALLMVLWLFMVLTIIVAEFNRSMRDDAVATQNLAEETVARGVALAGMSRAIYSTLRIREQHVEGEVDTDDDQDADVVQPGIETGAPSVPLWQADGTWHEEQYAGGKYAVRIIDEGGKIALNRADEMLLRQVFANLGLEAKAQQEVVDAILDWRDRDSLKRLNGAEADYYLGLAEPYRPKDGPFDSVDELLLVRGITRDLFYGQARGDEDQPPIPLSEVFSVFNRSANINVRTAPPAVLRVLIGGGEEDLEEILEAREDDPASALSLMRAKIGNQLLARRLVMRPASTIAIDARATMDKGRLSPRVGAVVNVEEDADGFYVARWLDRLPAL